MAEASEHSGLDDFGDDGFRDGLDCYVESVRDEAQLSDIGEFGIHAAIVAALANRLRVVDFAARHREVAAEVVDAPIVVIGMFRAGTTLLSNLLDRDPRNRALLRWEAGDSVPPPTPADHRRGPRVDAAQAGNDQLEALNPKVRAIHHEEANGPTECISVMSQDFKSLSWEAIANVASYGRWLRGADQRSAYEYHRLVLQVLQHGGVRGQWTLKSPHHALALDALTAVYPDAHLVLVHRDPVVLCASVCSLISTLSATFSDADHRQYIAAHWTEMLDDSVQRIDAFRDGHPEHRIVDVQYADLVRTPLATVGSLYRAVGRELDPAAEAAMAGYLAAHPKGAFGHHHYDLAEYGLSADELTERFDGYQRRYGIEREASAAD
jgi:hypothetical protein